MQKNLIYDIGANHGEDTAYYLHKGYKVVAVEANPILVDELKKKFTKEIRAGRLALLNVGVGEKSGKATFWINERDDEWSSFIKEEGCRYGSKCHSIEVEVMPLRGIIKKYGVPYYMKSDIEGNDLFCLKDLTPETSPDYISVEAHSLEYLAILYGLGYRKFKFIDQSNLNSRLLVNLPRWKLLIYKLVSQPWWRYPANWLKSKFPSLSHVQVRPAILIRVLTREDTWVFPTGSSGPFGEETPGQWGGAGGGCLRLVSL